MKYITFFLFFFYNSLNSYSQSQEELFKWLFDESNIVDTIYNKAYYKNGNLKDETVYLLKKFDEKFSYQIPIGISKSYDKKGHLDAEYHFDKFGQPLHFDLFYSFKVGKIIINTTVDTTKGYLIKIKNDFLEVVPVRKVEKIKDENGEVFFEGEYFKEKKHGKWIWYFSDGIIEKTIIYENGKKISKEKTSVKEWLDEKH